MKLRDLAYPIYEEKKKIKYDMTAINGGFSDGVDIMPAQGGATMDVSVDIYGGTQTQAHLYQVPPAIQKLQQQVVAAKQRGVPVPQETTRQLNTYYNNIKQLISVTMVKLMKQLDAGAKESITAIIQQENAKYS